MLPRVKEKEIVQAALIVSGDLDRVYTETPLEIGRPRRPRHVGILGRTGVEAQGPQTPDLIVTVGPGLASPFLPET